MTLLSFCICLKDGISPFSGKYIMWWQWTHSRNLVQPMARFAAHGMSTDAWDWKELMVVGVEHRRRVQTKLCPNAGSHSRVLRHAWPAETIGLWPGRIGRFVSAIRWQIPEAPERSSCAECYLAKLARSTLARSQGHLPPLTGWDLQNARRRDSEKNNLDTAPAYSTEKLYAGEDQGLCSRLKRWVISWAFY